MSMLGTLICILIALGVQRFLGIRFSIADYDWFKPYTDFLHKHLDKSNLMQGYVGVAVVVLPILLVVGLIYLGFGNISFGMVGMIISAALLFYTVDATDDEARLKAYLQGKSGEEADKEVEVFLGEKPPAEAHLKARAISQAVLTKSLTQVYAILFWFALLGGFGVMLYFMVSTIASSKNEHLSKLQSANAVVLGALDWLPVRILGLSMALVGSFGNVFVKWMKSLTAGLAKNVEFAISFGLAALGYDADDAKAANVEENKQVIDLMFRTLITWVVVLGVLAVVTLF